MAKRLLVLREDRLDSRDRYHLRKDGFCVENKCPDCGEWFYGDAIHAGCDRRFNARKDAAA